ncbi:MAG: late competence development ComFB family protein [Pseudanabaenaceae cyanobacterium]
MQPKQIVKIVEQALKDGYLTPAMEAEVGRICDSNEELSVEEYMALDRLMGALLTGEVVAVPRKQFVNIMEELVLDYAIRRIAELETNGLSLNLSDIAAYALNRLPPLYATTQEGARYQEERAHKELHHLIAQRVEEAIALNQQRPRLEDRIALTPQKQADLVTQISELLKAYAPTMEP